MLEKDWPIEAPAAPAKDGKADNAKAKAEKEKEKPAKVAAPVLADRPYTGDTRGDQNHGVYVPCFCDVCVCAGPLPTLFDLPSSVHCVTRIAICEHATVGISFHIMSMQPAQCIVSVRVLTSVCVLSTLSRH